MRGTTDGQSILGRGRRLRTGIDSLSNGLYRLDVSSAFLAAPYLQLNDYMSAR